MGEGGLSFRKAISPRGGGGGPSTFWTIRYNIDNLTFYFLIFIFHKKFDENL